MTLKTRLAKAEQKLAPKGQQVMLLDEFCGTTGEPCLQRSDPVTGGRITIRPHAGETHRRYRARLEALGIPRDTVFLESDVVRL